MLKIATVLASLLISSTVLAGAEPAPPAPYPEGAPPQKADSSNPGSPADRLGKPSDSNTTKNTSQPTDNTKKDTGNIEDDSSDDVN